MQAHKKRIVICSDGTWNTPETPTNVVKIVRAIKPIGSDGVPQIVFYDQGVGTSNWFDRFIGGVFGKGIEQNVLDAYRFIAHNYQIGDEIYCFGFSRGAYTARALGGMLHTIGLLPKDELQNLITAYQYYRTPPAKRTTQSYQNNLKPEIELMAVWDTVGSLGAPTPLLRRFTKPLVGFFNTHLSPEIKNAYQALAIDEKRGVFKPALWTGEVSPGQTIEQVWFSGVHSDVGGGYQETGLSDNTLLWMIQKSAHIGLEFDDQYLENKSLVHANQLAPIHDSYSLPYRLLEKAGMPSGIRSLEGESDDPPINVTVHESVHARINRLQDYRPENIVDTLGVTKTEDRRHYTRIITSQFKGTIKSDERDLSCDILDYSPLGGVRVECDDDLDISDAVAISSSKFAKTLATCEWKDGNTYGLKFAA